MWTRLPIVVLSALLALPASAAGAAPSDADPEQQQPVAGAYGALAANFNQNLDAVNDRELRLSGADWVRGFFPMPAADDGDPAEHFAIKTIVGLSDRGYRTILSLKFPYNKASFPEPGSAAMAAELARLDRVLPTVLGTVGIITIGNEPFIESLPEERDERLNDFYETVARHVIEVRDAQCSDPCGTALYMGALNRLDLPDRRSPAAERWMTFVRETPQIAGVDIHPHLPDPAAAQPFLDYILPRMRPDQTFLVTEFSLVWYWQQHLRDTVSPEYADSYGIARDTQVWQVIRSAIDEPFSERKWHDFLISNPWFVEQSGFLADQLRLYRSTGRLAVAGYGFKQDDLMVQDFGPTKTPWLLNSVFAPYTVQSRGDAMSAPGYWLDDFRDLQRH